MASIWKKSVSLPPRESLVGERQTEVAVVGAGMAGLLTAWFLQRRGIKTLVLEADRVAGGQTGNTTAKITAQHAMIYTRLIREKGEAAARQYASASQGAVEEYRRMARDQRLDCELRDSPALLYSTLEEDPLRALAARFIGMEDFLHMPPWNSSWFIQQA